MYSRPRRRPVGLVTLRRRRVENDRASLTPLSPFAYYRRVTRPNRKFTTLFLALFACAVAAAFFVHDAHDRACAESCHICHFCRAANGADLTLTTGLDFFATATPLFINEAQAPGQPGRSLSSARAPPAF